MNEPRSRLNAPPREHFARCLRNSPALLVCILLGASAGPLSAQDTAPSDPSQSETPHVAQNDAFPPPDSARYLAGELVHIDHVNRVGILRSDRLDSYAKHQWDLPHHFTMLPYGSIYYHGAPAELRDIPIGTHLHGYFYVGPEGPDPVALPDSSLGANLRTNHQQRSPEAKFSRVLRLEDDFSFYQRRGSAWKILSINRETGKLTAERVMLGEQNPSATQEGLTGQQSFFFYSATRVWKGRQIASLAELTADQVVQLNLTWATLYGPGRCTDVWIDEESRRVAAEQQRQTHIQHQRHRGLAARVDHVEFGEAGAGIVTTTLYAGMDPELYDAFKFGEGVAVVVVEASLRSHDQTNDGAWGHVHEINKIENPPPGSSGFQVKIALRELLEGIRPGRTVRLFAHGFTRDILPLEERLWPKDVRFLHAGP